ncbi:M18 family aminopeptidase [Rhizomicrobium electricum]|uniref:M18 family aminopeptidase n=1 Tax=Rhizomicrobium electricum TaxID=480070 RepID=A0ABN1EFK8_9PROT|nr:M18 family aminopeptidase [Rhizomicrobium electricum]NIJ48576.1 aspartyl aminopeptidase [Rhizomicrobium electricum]
MPHYAESFLSYIDRSPSPYHAIAEAVSLLTAAGFVSLEESERWALKPGGAYFVVRGGKSIVAWRQGSAPAAEAGFRFVAAHSDSPVLKLRPRPDLDAKGLRLLTAEVYGGPLLSPWFDRELKLAGAVWCGGGTVKRHLVDLPKLPVRLVSLAIHLKSDKGSDSFTLDREKDLAVFVGQGAKPGFDLVREAIAEALGGDPGPILSIDLSLGDAAPAVRLGAEGELISAPRLDNLFSAFTALTALIESTPAEATLGAIVYDAEEIGSQTYTGARSNFVESVVDRIVGGGSEDVWRAKARSLIVSADMAHAEHPSFTSATDPVTVPALNGGLAVKTGVQGNYAIGPAAEAWFLKVCEEAKVPLQRFRYRCDHGRGSSIGPMATSGLGMAGIDVGAPMLAMHSVRELAGTADLEASIKAFAAMYASREPLPV